MHITPSGKACGAHITGLDLSKPLSANTLQGIREAWLEHHVLAFPNQDLSDGDLVRVTQEFGGVVDDDTGLLARCWGRTITLSRNRLLGEARATLFDVRTDLHVGLTHSL